MCELCPTILRDVSLYRYHDMWYDEVVPVPDPSQFLSLCLPLHMLLSSWNMDLPHFPELIACFRLFMRLCPEAAGVRNGNGQRSLDIALENGMDTHNIRILLAKAHALDRPLRRQLNWDARRMAMFLAYNSAAPSTIWKKLAEGSKDMLYEVVSFL